MEKCSFVGRYFIVFLLRMQKERRKKWKKSHGSTKALRFNIYCNICSTFSIQHCHRMIKSSRNLSNSFGACVVCRLFHSHRLQWETKTEKMEMQKRWTCYNIIHSSHIFVCVPSIIVQNEIVKETRIKIQFRLWTPTHIHTHRQCFCCQMVDT